MAGVCWAQTHVKIPVNPEPPWVIQEAGEVGGIDAEIIKLMAREVGFTYELVPCPWARCLKMMEEGQADFMLGVFKRPEREAYLKFVEPGYLADDPKAFYVTQDSPVSITAYSDLVPLNIGVVRGVAYFEPFDGDNRLKKQQVSNEWQLMQMLLHKRLDTFIATPTAVTYLINTRGLQGKFRRAIFQHHITAYSHMAIAKASTFVNQWTEVSETVARLQKQGEFRKVVDSVLGEPVPVRGVPQ